MPNATSAATERRLNRALESCANDPRRLLRHLADTLANFDPVNHTLFGTKN